MHHSPKTAPFLAVLTGLIVAMALFERFYLLGSRGFWYDELFTVLSASEHSLTDFYQNWAIADMHPPLHSIGLFYWFKVFPNTEFWARLPSVLAGLALLPLIYFKTKGLMSEKSRYIAVCLLCMSHAGIYFAQEARSYIFVVLLAFWLHLLWAQVLFVKKSYGTRDLVATLALSLLLAYTHYFGLFYALFAFGFATLYGKLKTIPFKKACVFLAVFLIAYIPGFILLLHSLQLRISDQQEQMNGLLFVPKFLNFLFFDDAWLLLGVVLLAGYLFWRRFHRVSLPSQPFTLYNAVFLVALFAIYLVGSFATPTFQYRYTLVWLPTIVLLLAMFVDTFIRRQHIAYFAAFVLCLQIFHLSKYRKHKKQQWDVATRQTVAALGKKAPVFVLGVDSDLKAIDYLRSGDIDGFFNCRMNQFFAYYFARLNGNPSRLVDVADSTTSLHKIKQQLLDHGSSESVVLAGHHLSLSPESLDFLAAEGLKIKMRQLASTRVYSVSLR